MEVLKRVKKTLAMSLAAAPVILFMVTLSLGPVLLCSSHEQPQTVWWFLV